MKPTVTVLMSVFNGARYVRAQIDSILDQRDVDVVLIIRDDGSTDDTLRVLRDYSTAHRNVVVEAGRNVGARDSFLSLLVSCTVQSDYYAFSDADDVWLPQKLSAAVDALQRVASPATPALYASRVRYVDSDLKDLGLGPGPRRPLTFANALIECRASGATAVFTHAATEALRRYDYRAARTHDGWVYMVVTAFGPAVFDDRSFILYRQHGGNLTGNQLSRRVKWTRRLQRPHFAALSRHQAASFLAQAGEDVRPEDLERLRRFVEHANSPFNRLRFALRPSVEHQSRWSDAFFRLLVLIGRT